MHTLGFWLGLFFSFTFGFFTAGAMASNRSDEQWHNGFRAGRYGQGSGDKI